MASESSIRRDFKRAKLLWRKIKKRNPDLPDQHISRIVINVLKKGAAKPRASSVKKKTPKKNRGISTDKWDNFDQKQESSRLNKAAEIRGVTVEDVREREKILRRKEKELPGHIKETIRRKKEAERSRKKKGHKLPDKITSVVSGGGVSPK